jgi:LuxR family quorum sensing-dependent transcriptional regulator
MISSFHRNFVFDTFEEISRVSLLPQVASIFKKSMDKLGFTSFGINSLPPPGKSADPIVLLENTPTGFRGGYIEERFYLIDHICAHARKAYEPFRYSEAPYAQKQSCDRERFMQALCTYGMAKGLIVPVGRPASNPACVWLAGENPDLHDDVRSVVQLVAMFTASKAHAISRLGDGLGTSNLTQRQREVLCWIAQGKSAWEISEILRISKRTVDHHTQQAARKLRAVTRTQAVVNAIRSGDINL